MTLLLGLHFALPGAWGQAPEPAEATLDDPAWSADLERPRILESNYIDARRSAAVGYSMALTGALAFGYGFYSCRRDLVFCDSTAALGIALLALGVPVTWIGNAWSRGVLRDLGEDSWGLLGVGASLAAVTALYAVAMRPWSQEGWLETGGISGGTVAASALVLGLVGGYTVLQVRISQQWETYRSRHPDRAIVHPWGIPGPEAALGVSVTLHR